MPVRDLRTMLIAGAAILLLAAGWVIYVATRPPEVISGGGTASQYAPSSVAPPPTAALALSPTEVASSVSLPSAGGTCSASQIEVGTATYGYGYGTLGTTSVFVTLPLRNVAGDCVLHLPAVIGVASATGPFEAVSVDDIGTQSATGDNSPAQSAHIRAGRSLSIMLGASWPSGNDIRPANGTPFPTPPCLNPISAVTRVAFPLATGRIQIELPTVFQQVCSSPASTSLGIKAE